MRKEYHISSQILNQKLLLSYENLVYLLGQHITDQPHYSGLYEYLDVSGKYLSTTPSGIPVGDTPRVTDILKFDYFYRKHFKQIRN
jgi:hypothetical protein